MRIERSCEVCGAVVLVHECYVPQGRGRFCSRGCRARGLALQRFREQHGGRTPREVERLLHERGITLAEYAAETGIRPRTLYGHVARFGITPFRPEPKEKVEHVCERCGKPFSTFDRPSRAGRGRYCGPACRKASLRREFDESSFRGTASPFVHPDPALGNYTEIPLGPRQRSFVNRGKLDHFFFRDGIVDEGRAYVFGVLLTDGNVRQGAKGSYYVRLELTDHDIVQEVARVLSYRGRLHPNPRRRTLSLVVASPYLYHDLVALGCGPGKTSTARYPVIPAELDRHLVRGIVDGDGSWVRSGRNQLSLQIAGNDLLLQGLQRRVEYHIGVKPQAVSYPGDWDPAHRMKSFCQVRYNKTDSIQVRDWLFSDATIFGERKRREACSPDSSYMEKLTTPRMAAYLGVSVDFVKRGIRRHGLPHSRIGPYYFFTPEQVAVWEERLRQRLRDPRCRLPDADQLRLRWLLPEEA